MGMKPRAAAVPVGGATTRLVFRRGTSNKFWEVTIDGAQVTTTFGRVGTKGRARTLRYASAADAKRSVEHHVQHRLKKGYVPESQLGSEADRNQSARSANAKPAETKPAIAQTMTFAGEDPIVLYSRGGAFFLVRYRRGKPQNPVPVARSMWLSTAFEDAQGPAVMLASQRGTTQLIRDGQRGKTFSIDTAGTGRGKRGYLGYMTAFRQEPHLLGYRCQVYRFTGAKWLAVDAGLRGEKTDSDTGLLVHDDRLLVLNSDARGFALLSFDGKAWKQVCRGKEDYNCMASHAGAVYLAGEGGVLRVSPRGKTTAIYRPDPNRDEDAYAPWSACSFAGDLVLSDHHTVKALRRRALIDLAAPADPKRRGASHNQCLYPRGDTLYVARRDGVHVLRKGSWTTLPAPS